MTEINPNYKKNLKPKEFHPSVHLVKVVFQSAGQDYINLLMNNLAEQINSSEDPSSDVHGVVYETLRKVQEGEGLNDRYLMGATLYILATLIPFNAAIQSSIQALMQEEEPSDDTEQA